MTITAKRVEKPYLIGRTGLETVLDFTATALLFLGFFLALIAALTFRLEGLLASISTLFSSVMGWLLLRSLAEILRLLKKLAGKQYQGSISGPQQSHYWACSHCGHMLHTEHRCEHCGAEIVDEDGNPSGNQT